MEVTPLLTSCEFAKLDPGDLFALRRGSGSYISLAVKDPNVSEKVMLILGPASSDAPKVPLLMRLSPQTRVVSFAKDYRLRLPCVPETWLNVEPPEGSQCLVLTADNLCMRANFRGAYDTVLCYVDVREGLLLRDGNGNFANPTGDRAYTSEWALLTMEEEAREILVVSPAHNVTIGSLAQAAES
jgi:hypothetical protein